MRCLRKYLVPTASGLLVLCLPGSALAQSVTGTSATPREASNVIISASNSSASNELIGLAGLPDSPGTVRIQSQSASAAQRSSSEESSAQQSSSRESSPSSSPPETPANLPQPAQSQTEQQTVPAGSKPQQPIGTAAAEAPVVSGSPVAEPAGVAIAPARQHRVRTIVIKVGAIVGAGVALGTVLALTEGTSSRPPGAH
jgi:hypothetical protein